MGQAWIVARWVGAVGWAAAADAIDLPAGLGLLPEALPPPPPLRPACPVAASAVTSASIPATIIVTVQTKGQTVSLRRILVEIRGFAEP